MNTAAVDPIVRAVLYEGHILYPYRPTAIKNRQRFTFGRVYPRTYSRLEKGKEPCAIVTQVLVESDSDDQPVIEVCVRFLQPILRQILAKDGTAVEQMTVDGQMHQTWHDVIERSIEVPRLVLTDGARSVRAFAFAAASGRDAIRANGSIGGYEERRQPRLSGSVELRSEVVEDGLFRVSATVTNETTLPERLARERDELLLRVFASTHTILQISGGRFVSLMDPPEHRKNAADSCENYGTWPVLAGEYGRRDTMLSSPIILYDYPEIAPESAGDLCDGTEIDELLSLRIMTLTDDEKTEMAAVDGFARRILHRTENLGEEELFGMHGTMRALKQLTNEEPPEFVEVQGQRLTVGDRVRIRPSRLSDVFDVALVNKTAEIESIEQDFEGKIHLALIIDDDPGKDMGKMRMPAHRFFYGLDEVELIEEG